MKVDVKCKHCNHVWNLRLDPALQIDPKKLVLKACHYCDDAYKKKEFPKIKDHGMPMKRIPVKDIPGYFVDAEIKPVKSPHYKLAIPLPS